MPGANLTSLLPYNCLSLLRDIIFPNALILNFSKTTSKVSFVVFNKPLMNRALRKCKAVYQTLSILVILRYLFQRIEDIVTSYLQFVMVEDNVLMSHCVIII